MTTEGRIDELRTMTIGELRAKHLELFGEPARTGNRGYLWRRLAWRIQAGAEGELSERARLRARELANDADLRVCPPRNGTASLASAPGTPTAVHTFTPSDDARLPPAGSVLRRLFKGRSIEVAIRPDGFEWEGTLYGSLSAAVNAATGTRWNGYVFFGITTGGRP